MGMSSGRSLMQPVEGRGHLEGEMSSNSVPPFLHGNTLRRGGKCTQLPAGFEIFVERSTVCNNSSGLDWPIPLWLLASSPFNRWWLL